MNRPVNYPFLTQFIELNRPIFIASKHFITATTDLVVSSTHLFIPSRHLLVSSRSVVIPSRYLFVSSRSVVIPSTYLLVSSSDLFIPSSYLFVPSRCLEETPTRMEAVKMLSVIFRLLFDVTPCLKTSVMKVFIVNAVNTSIIK